MNQINDPYGSYYTNDTKSAESLSRYTAKTFGWMCLGLLITFAVAIGTLLSGLYIITASRFVPFLLALCELGVVIYLSARIRSLSVGAARSLFFAYAVLNGVTFSSLLIYYSVTSLIFVFGMTAVFFGIMALYAYLTKADLTYLRPVLMGGLITLFILMLLSMILHLSAFSTGICLLGVLLFVGFTAYDTQKIRQNYFYYQGNTEPLEKASIFSALQLYLDFINLFLYLLRLFGRRSN